LTGLWILAIVVAVLITSHRSEAAPKPYVLEIIREYAKENGLQYCLVYAIMMVESNGNPHVIGGLGEIGLFQLRPEFFIEGASFNVVENTRVATNYLKKIKRLRRKQFPKSWFVFYNHGPYAKLRAPSKTEYYKKVMNVKC